MRWVEDAGPPSLTPSPIVIAVRKNKNMNSVPVIGGIVTCTFFLFTLVVILIYHLRRRRSNKKTEKAEVINDESIDDHEFEKGKKPQRFPCDESIDDYEFEKGKGPQRFSYDELVDATNGFEENNKLGQGGFGSVYRGILKNGNIDVAVKRVSKKSKQGKKGYIAEVKIISKLRHKNLVQLVGWCHDDRELLLVYELVPNGSLDKHLHHNLQKDTLTWPERHNIALGLCSALFYLHEECEKCVVHRDIKPSNIMLDSSFNAKLGDFGLARLTDHNQDVKTAAAGTEGYIAPECLLGTANASTKSDVFSFGIVLLEITCGRRPIMPQQYQRKVSLVEWVWDLYGRNALLEAVDTRLNGDFIRKEVECLMTVGLWCAHPDNSKQRDSAFVKAKGIKGQVLNPWKISSHLGASLESSRISAIKQDVLCIEDLGRSYGFRAVRFMARTDRSVLLAIVYELF
ncbi:hypothetical protein LUZ61_013642 [Rhynchospora tenuis]|uniref:Protein kinase domain-containing protein n=1 Tax=Rhynchospora tenuis TaxID=198213 RepID=A0AAD5WAX8_9POAL|nr:hypothetical protein LUZ61_013642 [Rhynchospora tenuis]